MLDSLVVRPNSQGELKLPGPYLADVILSLTTTSVLAYVTHWDQVSRNPRIEWPAVLFLDEQLRRWNKRHHIGTFLGSQFPDSLLWKNQNIEISNAWSMILPQEIQILFNDTTRRAHMLLLRWYKWQSVEGFALSFQLKFPAGSDWRTR